MVEVYTRQKDRPVFVNIAGSVRQVCNSEPILRFFGLYDVLSQNLSRIHSSLELLEYIESFIKAFTL